ncbi:MAG: STAS domain-containing protein [Bacteroidales bacterium]|nr:STAS domain-containing protein [Bacteroidales bacterium]MBP5214077.1 STAS domain-containing protein [Bacteroidales bacterium]
MTFFDFRPKLVSCLKGYNMQKFSQDAMAGLITGIVALPLAIAFGIASGVSPEKGIITAIVAGFIISLLGGSKVQIGGPTGAFIVIIYSIVTNPAYGEEGLLIATLLAGVLLILMGVFKMGSVIKFIPYPIIIGFTAGIAVTIFTTQMGDVFGLKQEVFDPATGAPILDPETGEKLLAPLKTPGDFIGKWICYFEHFQYFNLWNFAVALLSVLTIIFSPKLFKSVPGLNKIPGSLYAIVFITLIVLLMKEYGGITGIDTIGDRFTIQGKLPKPIVPDITFDMIRNLIPVAFTIAILGAIESLLSAAVADGVIGDQHNSNTELIAQGVANMASPLFGGIPATGAIARTMTNINNGGRTPVAGIIHAVVLLLILIVLMPLANYIPMACLAGVLVIVSYNMSGWRTFRAMLKNPKSDVSVLLVTFFLTIIFDLTVAIEFGIVLACLLLIRRIASVGHITLQENEIDANNDTDVTTHEEALQIPEGVQVYEIDGPFFFGIANKFEELSANMLEVPMVRIIRMRKVPFVDATGLHNLEVFIHKSHQQGIHVVLSGVRPEVLAVIRKSSLYGEVGEKNIFDHINGAMARAQEVVAHPHIHHRVHSNK